MLLLIKTCPDMVYLSDCENDIVKRQMNSSDVIFFMLKFFTKLANMYRSHNT